MLSYPNAITPELRRLAQLVDAARDQVITVHATYGYGETHSAALSYLLNVATELANAESAAGMPRGSTRDPEAMPQPVHDPTQLPGQLSLLDDRAIQPNPLATYAETL